MGNLNEHPSRRTFLRKSLLFCTFSGLVTSGFCSSLRALSSDDSKPPDTAGGTGYPDLVSVEGTTAAAVKRAFDLLGGASRFVKPGQRVLLKPNMGFANPPEWATTTNPEVVLAVAELLLAAGAKTVLVGDNPNRKPEHAIERCGIGKALEGLSGVRTLLINRPRDFRKVPVPGGDQFDELSVAALLSKVDLLINIPIAKSHQATGVSFGLKNLMGLIEDRRAFHTKYDLHRSIADMNRVIRPVLTILDATTVLTTGGPTGPGKTIRKNLVIAGTDRVAVDAYGVTLERWNGRSLEPGQVSHIGAAHKAGLGEIDLEKVKIVKETVRAKDAGDPASAPKSG